MRHVSVVKHCPVLVFSFSNSLYLLPFSVCCLQCVRYEGLGRWSWDVEVMQAEPSITYLTCMPEIELARSASWAHDFFPRCLHRTRLLFISNHSFSPFIFLAEQHVFSSVHHSQSHSYPLPLPDLFLLLSQFVCRTLILPLLSPIFLYSIIRVVIVFWSHGKLGWSD